MLVPYSKYYVVARPFGLTVPLSVADVGVDARRGAGDHAARTSVVKIPSAPWLVPAPFVATKR